MKKGIIVLLITVLVSSMAFAADLTGSAEVKGNLDLNALKAKESALTIVNDSEITVDLGLANVAVAPAALEEGEEAPAISVDFAASFKFKVAEDGETKAEAKISKASIKGVNWEVSLLGSADALNYASMYGYNAKSNYAKNPGVTVTYDGFKLGLGYTTKGTWNASLETKSFEVIDGLTIQGGVSYSATAAAPEYGYAFTTAGSKTYKALFKKNADGTYAKDSTGSYEAAYYDETGAAGEKESKTLYELQNALNKAQVAEKAAKKAYLADESNETLYEAYVEAQDATYYAGVNLSMAETGITNQYYSRRDDGGYSFDDDGYVYYGIVWGGLKKVEGATEYTNIGDDAISELGASLKVNYASDMLNGGVATDLIFDTLAKKAIVDVKATAGFMGAGLDVYYSNLGTVKLVSTGKDAAVKHVLNAQLTFDVNKFVELPVTVSGSVGMENILGKDTGNGIRVLKTSLAVGYDAFALSGSFNFGLVDKSIALAGEFSYAHEIVTAKIGGSLKTVKVLNRTYDADSGAYTSSYAYPKQLGLYVSAENTSLIPGATLALSWSADDLRSVNSSVDNKIGIVTASCSIEF